MLYILVALALTLVSNIHAVRVCKKSGGTELDLTGYFGPVKTIALTLAIIFLLFIYGFDTDNSKRYTTLSDTYNPIQTEQLQELPFETTPFEKMYVSRSKDSHENSTYQYCIKTENGYIEKNISTPLFGHIYINYISEHEQPRIECQSKTQNRVLIKKPSFWFNLFGWIRYKDCVVGDVVETVDIYITAYTFYVPEGTLMDICKDQE